MVERFISYLQYEKRFSAHTITSYRTDLEQFSEFLSLQKIEIAKASHIVIRAWIVSLMDSKMNPRSVNRKITTLRSFYRFLRREKIIESSPMVKIQGPKAGKKLPEFVDEKKMQRLLEQPVADDFKSIRNKLIMAFFYMTGIRLSELIGLKLSDVDLYHLAVRVLGKRSKVRHVPITQEFKKEIDFYLNRRTVYLDELKRDSEVFFISDKGNKLNPKSVYNLVHAELSAQNEITNTRKSPHVLRHSFATAMLNAGADINAIKELLGHSSLAATQVYTHNTIEKLKEIYKQAFPKAQ